MTEKEIMVLEMENNYPYDDGPLPDWVRVYEDGHDTNNDIKLCVADYGNNGYAFQIEQGVLTPDGTIEVEELELDYMNLQEVRRLARLFTAAAEYIERNWEND